MEKVGIGVIGSGLGSFRKNCKRISTMIDSVSKISDSGGRLVRTGD